MDDLTRDMRTLFNAADPLHLYGHGREHEYDRAVDELEKKLGEHESPEHINELLEGVFKDLYGVYGTGDYAFLAHEIADLMGALGV